jgi:hypothetical protein
MRGVPRATLSPPCRHGNIRSLQENAELLFVRSCPIDFVEEESDKPARRRHHPIDRLERRKATSLRGGGITPPTVSN